MKTNYNKEYKRQWDLKNKDKIKVEKKEYYLKNKDNFKKYYLKNKDKIKLQKKSHSLKTKYGITLNEYNAMREQQNYRCAIAACNKHESEFQNGLCVDHDHKTGKVRDLLCTNCNTVYGKAKENINILYGLIDYAIKYNKKDN
tara:strand:- start:44 stop:472 length:429 start_codon:yes stop_codon:yes gene_type:complete